MDAGLRIKAIGPGPARVLNGGRPSVTLAPLGLGCEAQPFSRLDRDVFGGLGKAQQDEVVCLVHLVQGIPNIHRGCWLSQSEKTDDAQCPGRWGEKTLFATEEGPEFRGIRPSRFANWINKPSKVLSSLPTNAHAR